MHKRRTRLPTEGGPYPSRVMPGCPVDGNLQVSLASSALCRNHICHTIGTACSSLQYNVQPAYVWDLGSSPWGSGWGGVAAWHVGTTVSCIHTDGP